MHKVDFFSVSLQDLGERWELGEPGEQSRNNRDLHIYFPQKY